MPLLILRHRLPPALSALPAVTLGLVLLASPLHLAAQGSTEALTEATQMVRAGHYDEALSRIHKAFPTGAKDPRLRTVEGIAYSLKGDDFNALKALDKALASSPNFAGALRAKAEILSRRRDPAAIAVLRQILKASPGDPTATEMLALAEAQSGHCTDALAHFDQVGAALETHIASLQQQAGCFFEQKDYPRAVLAFEHLRSLRPDDPGTAYDLALTQWQAGDPKGASATLASLLSTTQDVDLLLLGSDLAEEQGDTPNAAGLLRRAIVADPTRAPSYVRFAELCMAHESYQAGVDMVSAGLSRMPGESTLYLARGLLYGGMAKYTEAEQDFQAAELRDPHHGTGAYAVGLVQAQRNDIPAALLTVRAGLKTHPEDAQLHFLLARLLLESGAKPGSAPYGEATERAESAVRLDPRLTQAHDLLARIYQELGQQARAVVECRAALAQDPTDQNALYRLVRALRETGDAAGARAAAQQVAEMHQKARQDESSRLRYRIEEGAAPVGGGTGTATQP